MLDALDLTVVRTVASVHGAADEIGVEILVGGNIEAGARRIEQGAGKFGRYGGIVDTFKANEKPGAVGTNRREADARALFPATTA